MVTRENVRENLRSKGEKSCITSAEKNSFTF
jgi:hypothetical protein